MGISLHLRDVGKKVEIKPNIDAKKVAINCEVEGELMEISYPIDLSNPRKLWPILKRI